MKWRKDEAYVCVCGGGGVKKEGLAITIKRKVWKRWDKEKHKNW